MSAKHPSPEIPQKLVDKIVARRGRLHAYEDLAPAQTALVVIDLDVGSCEREPDLTGTAIRRINRLGVTLRQAGGTVAFVTSTIGDPANLARRLGHEIAQQYVDDSQPGGIGTVLAHELVVEPGDVHATKLDASAFFPGRCDLHEQLQGRSIEHLLIGGLVTNICCESSARDAVELEYQVTMVSDANVGHSFGLHEAALASFFRFFGDVRPTSDVMRLIEEHHRGSAIS